MWVPSRMYVVKPENQFASTDRSLVEVNDSTGSATNGRRAITAILNKLQIRAKISGSKWSSLLGGSLIPGESINLHITCLW